MARSTGAGSAAAGADDDLLARVVAGADVHSRVADSGISRLLDVRNENPDLLPRRERATLLPRWEPMRIIARRTLQDFWESGHPEAEQPLRAWFDEAHQAEWKTTADIKNRYAHASIIDAERVVFNIGGNKFQLVVKLWFSGQTIWIKFVGTHEDYDEIDVTRL